MTTTGVQPRRRSIRAEDHLGLAYTWAHKAACAFGGETEDWIGPCWVAIEKAADGFDPALGNRFSTYAVMAMRRECLRESRTLRGLKRRGRSGEWVSRLTASSDRIDGAAADPQREPAIGIDMDTLSHREYEVVAMRMRGLTLDVVGRVLGSSHERIRQIQNAAFAKLREVA